MAVNTASSATINGVTYTRWKSFVAAKDGSGYSNSGGTGTKCSVTKGNTYYFYSYATEDGSARAYPYSISSKANDTDYIIGWFKADIFPSKKIKLTLNKNGGTGGTDYLWFYQGVGTYYSNEACTTVITAITKPTRTGYTFKEYQGDGTCGGTAGERYIAYYNDSGTYYEFASDLDNDITKDATLYAAWTANTYTVKYNANGGSGTTASSSHTYDTAKALTSNGFSRTGYTFLGWSTSSSATSATYSNGQSVSNLTATNGGTVNLYAVWKINSYTLTYNANGGSVSPTSKSVNYGAQYGTLPTPSRTGYTFKGWYTASSGGSQVSTTTTIGAGNVTIYAQWTINTYTISFNANGGSGAPSSQTKTYGQALTLSSVIPTKSGYTFMGWSTSSTATSATYSAGGNYVDNNNATLYAVWTQSTFIQTIMARYQLSTGGFTSYSQVYAASLNQGDTCSWSSTETNEYKSASVSYTVGTSAETRYVTVYRKQYTISYDANGGLFAPKTQTFYYGCNLHLTDRRPTRSGYDFLGWANTSDTMNPNYQIGDAFDSTDTSNPTLYAIWSKRSTNIYLYNIGLCEASEYVESDSLCFDVNGAIYADSFTEEILDDAAFSIGLEFVASEISEIYIEKYYLVDESMNSLIDENGNYLFLEEEV